VFVFWIEECIDISIEGIDISYFYTVWELFSELFFGFFFGEISRVFFICCILIYLSIKFTPFSECDFPVFRTTIEIVVKICTSIVSRETTWRKGIFIVSEKSDCDDIFFID